MSANSAEYQRAYRLRRPDYTKRNRELMNAKTKALFRLADMHEAEFRRLYEQECHAAGIDPPKQYRRLAS
jgi:hypothetical protein